MRLATWNINGLRARFEYLALWLNERQPDVVGLQELKLATDRFPHAELEQLGYSAAVHGQKSWNGVAILYRHETYDGSEPELERGLDGQEEQGARLVTVRFASASGGGLFGLAAVDELEFTTVYCPNGKNLDHEDFERKLDWYRSLIIHQSQRTTPARILCGDFNLCPGPLDTWGEEFLAGGIFHTDEERSRFADLLGTGLIDFYRESEPEGGQFSWWDYRAGAFHKNQGLRIDFLLGTASLNGRVSKVWTDRDFRKKKDGLVASDHAPVIADLT